MPENDYEVVIEGNTNDYYIKEKLNELLESDLYLNDNYNRELNYDFPIKVVGIKYVETSAYNYTQSKIYVSDLILDKLQFQINQSYSKVQILFEDQYYESTTYNPYFALVPNDNVPKGKAYVSRDLNDLCSNGSAINKNINIEVSNIYYEDEIELKVARTYNKNTLESLLDLTNYDSVNGSVFVNTEDYNSLFNKPSYQSAVLIDNVELINETKSNLEALNLNVLAIKDILINSGEDRILQVFRTVVTLVLSITLFFISYLVIKIILKSRNVYYSTLRMLGANKKISRQLLIIELFLDANIAYFGFIALLVLNKYNIIRIELFNTIVEYLKFTDFAVVYLILILMSFFISLKYARQLFRNSTIKTYNEEV